MIGLKILVPLLLVAALTLGACAGGAATSGVSTSSAGVQAVQLVGCEVRNLAGTGLGEVAGVLSDPETGAIAYLVVRCQDPQIYGRALMVVDPQRFVPIPWGRFTPGATERILRLYTDETTLLAAPYLEKAPAVLDTTQTQAIDAYWQLPNGEENRPDLASGPK